MNKTNIILITIFALGLFLRFFQISSNPVSLYWDEASIGYEAYSIAQTGKDMHGNAWLQAIFSAYGDYKAPVYIWFTSLAVKVLGPSVVAVRTASAVFGSLTILTIYFLALHIFKSSKTALASSFIIAILPWHVQFSRAGFEANVALFFVSLFLYFLLQGLSKKPTHLIVSSIFALFAVYSYFSARIIIPLVFIWAILFNYKQVKNVFPHLLIGLAIFLIGIVPIQQSPFYKDSNTLRLSTDNITQNHQGIVYANSLHQVDQNSWLSKIIHHRYLYQTKELMQNIFTHLDSGYLFFTGDENLRHSTGFSGLMLPTMLVLFAIGIFQLLKFPKQFLFIIGLWAIFLLPASVPRDVPHALRSLNAVIPVVLILAFGGAKLLEISSKKTLFKNATFLYGGLLMINALVFYIYLFKTYPLKSANAWQDGYPQIVQYAISQQASYDYIILLPEDRLYLYALLYGAIDSNEVQSMQSQKNTDQADRFTVNQIGKISFRPIVWQDDKFGPSRSLLIGLPDDFPSTVNIKDVIVDKNNQPRYVSVDLGQQ